MKAEALLHERLILDERTYVELVIWRLPSSVAGSSHLFKYRLALVVLGECVLRYDNETGKGDHKHRRGRQTRYRFTSPEQLLADFWNDVDRWRA